jgi:hypothetical protein
MINVFQCAGMIGDFRAVAPGYDAAMSAGRLRPQTLTANYLET